MPVSAKQQASAALGGLFEDASNFEQRYVPELDRIAEISAALKTLGVSVVLTSGSFDLIHQGHSLYLEAARQLGGFLIVGVDSDEKVRARKGEWRPIIPEDERLLMVTHQRGVGAVTLKHVWHEKWALIEAVAPDVLVATEDTYTDEQIAALTAGPCREVKVMGRMATVSTSARVRQLEKANRAESGGMKQLLAYVPVVHAGYQRFFAAHADADELLLLGSGFAADFPQLGKDIRAVSPETAARYIRTDLPHLSVRVVEPDQLHDAVTADVVVVPDEELMRAVVQQYCLDEDRQITYERTFLRWDRTWSLEERPVDYDGAVSADELAVTIMGEVTQEGLRSSDWWRQVGAAAVRDGEVVAIQHNRHVPTDYTPYLDGDPRNEFHRGVRPDLSTAIHAEALLIARFARDGRPTAGADIYVSAFPCPPCSRLIANAGFRRCYFRGSYGSLDGARVLRDAEVELIWVDTGSASAESHS